MEREDERVLGGRFIERRNRRVYPPQARNPEGERLEEMFAARRAGQDFAAYSRSRMTRVR